MQIDGADQSELINLNFRAKKQRTTKNNLKYQAADIESGRVSPRVQRNESAIKRKKKGGKLDTPEVKLEAEKKKSSPRVSNVKSKETVSSQHKDASTLMKLKDEIEVQIKSKQLEFEE